MFRSFSKPSVRLLVCAIVLISVSHSLPAAIAPMQESTLKDPIYLEKNPLGRFDLCLNPGIEKDLVLKYIRSDIGIEGRAGQASSTITLPIIRTTILAVISNPTGNNIHRFFAVPVINGGYVPPAETSPMIPPLAAKFFSGDLSQGVILSLKKDFSPIEPLVIPESVIYGIVRARAKEMLIRYMLADAILEPLLEIVIEETEQEKLTNARDAIVEHLMKQRKWKDTNAELFRFFLSIDLEKEPMCRPADRNPYWHRSSSKLETSANLNLGVLAAIGERRATLFLAYLASCVDKKHMAKLHKIISLWTGEQGNMSLDWKSGKSRPRSFRFDKGTKVVPENLASCGSLSSDVAKTTDYRNVKLSSSERNICDKIVEGLPTTSPFPALNLIVLPVEVPAHKTVTVLVSYRQVASVDNLLKTTAQARLYVNPIQQWMNTNVTEMPLGMLLSSSYQIKSNVPLKQISSASDNIECIDAFGQVYSFPPGYILTKKAKINKKCKVIQIAIEVKSTPKKDVEEALQE